MTKLRVNLYRPNLLPPKQRLTLGNLAVATMGLLGLFLVIGLYSYWQLNRLEDEKQVASAQKAQFDQQKTHLETQIAARTPDQVLIDRVDLETQQIALKRLLMSELSVRATLTSRGFAPVLTDLATVADASVWLNHIVLHEHDVMFAGFAEHPQSIPLWVSKLKTTQTLKGQAFSSMTMDRGDDQPLAFTLSSQLKEERQ